MEVKIVGAMPLWLADAMARLQIRRISFSKYGTAYKRYIRQKLYAEGKLKQTTAWSPLNLHPGIIQSANNAMMYQKGSM